MFLLLYTGLFLILHHSFFSGLVFLVDDLRMEETIKKNNYILSLLPKYYCLSYTIKYTVVDSGAGLPDGSIPGMISSRELISF